MCLTYDEALAYIASLAPRGWRLGLDRMQSFVERAGLGDSLGAPGGPQFIHVTGTNGKGSVTAIIQSILIEHGYRVGAFFSPFVYDPRERIQLGREMIAREDLADLTADLIPVADSFTDTDFGGITEFEFKTALGFLYWKRKRCEWVALEVGLGGRLDATNVVTPRACAIVSIGLDHTSVLGDTIEAIAHEKAGIIKSGVPVVIGSVPMAALNVIEREAQAKESRVWRFGIEVVVENDSVSTPCHTYRALKCGIAGPMQMHNLAVAIGVLDAARALRGEDPVRRGAVNASIPGRFQRAEWQGRRVLLDGAHNPDAARVLAQGLRESGFSPAVLITNMIAGHDPAHFYEPLHTLIRSAHVVPIAFHRALNPSDVANELGKYISQTRAHESVQAGLEAVLSGTQPGDHVLVTGSFYLVGEVGRAMGVSDR